MLFQVFPLAYTTFIEMYFEQSLTPYPANTKHLFLKCLSAFG